MFLFSMRHAPARSTSGVVVVVLTVAVVVSSHDSGQRRIWCLLWRLIIALETSAGAGDVCSTPLRLRRSHAAFTIALIYLITYGAASFIPLFANRDLWPHDRRKLYFTLVWIAPALLFFTFIFLKFVNSGYLLIVVAPGCLWLGYWASQVVWRDASWRESAKLALIGVCAAVNVLIFLVSPFYCSYRSVRRFENELDEIRSACPSWVAPSDTLIVGFDSHFLGYRHAGLLSCQIM